MFLGKSYMKQTAWDGLAEIGVAKTADGKYAATWRTKRGNIYPLNLAVLPIMDSRHEMQMLLDTWATDQKLEAA